VKGTDRLFVSQQKIQAEHELLKLVRVTETFEIFDTLTVCPELVENPEKFYELAI
jgi:hypothetical protein